MVFSEIRSLLNLTGQINKQVEYWQEYEGKEVIIRKHSVDRTRKEQSMLNTMQIQQTIFLIQGEIEAVMSFPPGFRLTNVAEYIANDDYSELNNGVSQHLAFGGRGAHKVREIDRKFVSFDSIEQLEWTEDADNATRPVRESGSDD